MIWTIDPLSNDRNGYRTKIQVQSLHGFLHICKKVPKPKICNYELCGPYFLDPNRLNSFECNFSSRSQVSCLYSLYVLRDHHRLIHSNSHVRRCENDKYMIVFSHVTHLHIKITHMLTIFISYVKFPNDS